MLKVLPKNTFLSRINSLEDELNRLKFEMLENQIADKNSDEEKLVDRIVEEARSIRQRLYREKYGQKTVRLS